MSLRARVVALIGAVLLLSVFLGTLVAGYQSRVALRAELVTGLSGGRTTIIAAFEDLPNSDHRDHDLQQLVATFNGNRHVRATLIDHQGRIVMQSETEMADRLAPSWFLNLLGRPPMPVTIRTPTSVPGYNAIVLQPIPELDAIIAWRQFTGVLLVLTVLTALGIALVHFVIGAAFRPLTGLAAQFERIGRGDYSGRVTEDGLAELGGLERGFNRMAAELAATTERNRLLTHQLMTIQDEERADIARDLHDEFGPHLFAVSMDAEMIVALCDSGRIEDVPSQARAIQGAVGHMQRQVRGLLGRLRPAHVTEFGLNAAVLDLVRFWSARRPDIAFDVDLPEDDTSLDEVARDVAYRILQEAVSNAVRHGDPRAISIVVGVDHSRQLRVSIVDDGSVATAKTAGAGLGLIGMRERVEAVGGRLVIGPNKKRPGWTTQAWLQLKGTRHPAAEAQ